MNSLRNGKNIGAGDGTSAAGGNREGEVRRHGATGGKIRILHIDDGRGKRCSESEVEGERARQNLGNRELVRRVRIRDRICQIIGAWPFGIGLRGRPKLSGLSLDQSVRR